MVTALRRADGSSEVIIDTSALVAILADEDDASGYAEKIGESRGATISAANYLECAIVLDNGP